MPAFGLAEHVLAVAGRQDDTDDFPVSLHVSLAALGQGRYEPVPADAPGALEICEAGTPGPGVRICIVDPVIWRSEDERQN